MDEHGQHDQRQTPCPVATPSGRVNNDGCGNSLRNSHRDHHQSFTRLRNELSQVVMKSCSALQHTGQSLRAAPLLARCYCASAALAAACFSFTRWRGCCAGRNFNLPQPVHYDCGPLGTVPCDRGVDYSFLGACLSNHSVACCFA